MRIEDDESQPKDGCFSSSFASSALAESGGEMPITRSADEETDRDVCVWKPSEMLSDGAILEYCQEANQRFDLSMEQVHKTMLSLVVADGFKHCCLRG